MSRIQQDQFVDDEEEECCPLCVEEFDLSDRNFRPCPCGYQICQFCYNNIKTTMNGLCPACRRPYDDSTIEWKTISPEEMARHKQQIAHKAKKNAQIRQKEAQKAEADSLSRKHLAGLRVVQKNLVYVTGLTPTIREDRLLDTLRGPDYFGQYGKIIKIVVSKARENAQYQQSVGVYVTFARKDDAEQCIKAVDGSSNGDRQLRAQYGTTKYCSAYLRGEQCNNRNCMFLHEPGEDDDSFTRQDLSMMNSIQTQQPSISTSSRAAPPAHPGPAVAAAPASTPMYRQDSNDTSSSSHDAPSLPATASWANKAVLERRASRSTIASNPSPLVTNAIPAQTSKPVKTEEPSKKKAKEKEKKEAKEKEKSAQSSKSATPLPARSPVRRPAPPSDHGFSTMLKIICSPDFKFVFSSAAFTEEEFQAIKEFPQLLDPQGGAKRRAMKEREKELALQREAESDAKSVSQQTTSADREESEATAGGSLQLGGEPEEGHDTVTAHLGHHAMAPGGQQGFGGALFGQNTPLAEEFSNLGLSNRGLTTQQQQQLLLSNFKSNTQPGGPLSNQQNIQSQQHGLSANGPGHTRQTSRFSFANDSASASANVQPVANQKLMSQQNSMMPKNSNQFGQMSQHQPLGGQFFTNVQGPPPGLKPTGTPPVGGTSMFGQGHGFATGGLGYGANAAGRNNSDAMYQDLLRSSNMNGGARLADAGKQETPFSAEEQASFNIDALVNDTEPELEAAHSIPATPLSGQFLSMPRRATPTIPPGFTIPAIPRAVKEDSQSRPSSRPMSRTTSSTITPAVPVIPITPIRPTTPAISRKTKQSVVTPTASVAVKSQPETPIRATGPSTVTRTPTTARTADHGKDDQSAQKKPPRKEESRRSTAEALTKEGIKVKTNKKDTEISPQKKSKKELKGEPKGTASATPATPVSTKRQLPGKLDIKAATEAAKIDHSPASISQQTEGQAKSNRTPGASASSVPASPATAATANTGSPLKRTTAPRTLRVVPTPKTEAPPPLTSAPAQSLPTVSTIDKLRSRQASIASVNTPGTPMSETTFDTASVTSAPISRASSPPPIGSKVGTAPVRSKTKSQAKKDRQERRRQIEEELAIEENKSDVEVVQAPIIGRVKKTKKPSATPKATPAAAKSQPPSPKPVKIHDEQFEQPAVASKPVQSAKTSATATPEPEPVQEAKEKREHTAQSIIADLQRTGELLASTLEFFKPLSSTLTHASRSTPASNGSGPPDLKIHFSEADLEALSRQHPVRLSSHNDKSDSRTLVTPSGKFFWGLSEELEEKALELERQIEELRGHVRFHPRRQPSHPTTLTSSSGTQTLPAIATALKEAGKKLNDNSTQHMPKLDHPEPPPPPPQPLTPADAGAYLNQFVLPRTDNPPPNQPRPEMAAVGGAPGSGTSIISVPAGKFAKAAQVVIEGGAVGSTEIDGMGLMAADLVGGVFVQGLEALVGAGLGMEGVGFGYGSGRGSVMSLEEAERAMQSAKREHDVLEKKLAGVMKRNKKGVVGGK